MPKRGRYRIQACPKCHGTQEYDILENDWVCFNCGKRGASEHHVTPIRGRGPYK